MYSIEELENLAREAHAAARAAHRLLVARHVYEETPGSEWAEERLRDSTFRAGWTQARLWEAQRQLCQERVNERAGYADEVDAAPLLTDGVRVRKESTNVREAALLIECAVARQKGAEAALWEAIHGENKPAINIAALSLHRVLSEYKEALQVLLGSRSLP